MSDRADELLRRYLKHAPNIAMMLNTLEQDWKRDNCWSEWDQATMTEQRAIHAAVDAYLNEKPHKPRYNLDFSGNGKVSVPVEQIVRSESWRRQLAGVKAIAESQIASPPHAELNTHTFDVHGPASGYAPSAAAEPVGQPVAERVHIAWAAVRQSLVCVPQEQVPMVQIELMDAAVIDNTCAAHASPSAQPIAREPRSCECSHDPTPEEESSRVCSKCGKLIIV